MLRDILVDEFQIRADEVLPTASRTDVGLDSVTMVELAAVLSSRLAIEIHDYELADAGTLAELARVVEERRLAGTAERAGPEC
ncbi:acyl carrier protein [Streptomyces sp. NPDC045714]|uniref:acyl carrier protein n=1 Tax=Streptomyces sp. NPDC045714 TaxID=3154913 RepID=UPI0033F8507A